MQFVENLEIWQDKRNKNFLDCQNLKILTIHVNHVNFSTTLRFLEETNFPELILLYFENRNSLGFSSVLYDIISKITENSDFYENITKNLFFSYRCSDF